MLALDMTAQMVLYYFFNAIINNHNDFFKDACKSQAFPKSSRQYFKLAAAVPQPLFCVPKSFRSLRQEKYLV